jgi:hypothetical protein
MLGVGALMLLVQAVPHISGAGNDAAIKAFREACIEGSLKLNPSRGRILKGREVTDFVHLSDWGRPTSRRTVIKLKEGASSYIVLAEYKNLQPKSIARICALVSGDVSKEQAAMAYVEGLLNEEPRPRWWPDIYVPEWTSDHPELGYRKRLDFRSDGSIVLEVGMYPAAAAEMELGSTKQ